MEKKLQRKPETESQTELQTELAKTETQTQETKVERIELPYFMIDGMYGFDQEHLYDPWMHLGGCAAVTACDLCIYLAIYRGMKTLYPFDSSRLKRRDYVKFSGIMKPYLRPRFMGINRLSIYTEGFGRYLKEHGGKRLCLSAFSGEHSAEEAKAALRACLAAGMPVPCLTLRHEDKVFDDYVWHWFLLTGIRTREAAFCGDAQAQTEQAQAEKTQSEQAQTGKAQTDQAQTDQAQTEQVKSEQSQTEQAPLQQAQPEPKQLAQMRQELKQAEQNKPKQCGLEEPLAAHGTDIPAKPGKTEVKIVTYGKWRWVDFERLWETAYEEKGGLILPQLKEA